MNLDEKKLNAQKYFIFKLMEYFRNTYGVLQSKRYDSLSAMCEEIVDIQNEINRSRVDTTHLQRGLDGLLEAFKYQWREHPLIRHYLFNRDIGFLISRIRIEGERDNNYFITIYNSMKSIMKKLESKSIVKIYIDVIKKEVLSYGEVDKLLDSFVSELLYQGYSLKYLKDWYLNDIKPLMNNPDLEEKDIINALDEIGNLACSRKKFYAIFPCRLPKELQRELEEQREIKIRNLLIISGGNVINEISGDIRMEERGRYLYTEVMSCDKYKAVEIIKNSVEGYTEIYKLLSNNSKSIISERAAFYISSDEKSWERITVEDALDMGVRLVALSKQDKGDIEDLIILRRTLNNHDGEYYDITIIERTLEIMKNALELSSANRLLNMWSALEYLSTYYYRDKIIERIRCLIPRVICLYYIKNKMNILWDRMKYHRYKGDLEYVNLFVDSVAKEQNRLEFDRVKFAKFIMDRDSAGKLCRQFSRNTIIQREIAELNGLLNNKEGVALTSIQELNELIKQDLNRIYRVRNKLVHSGSKIPENIDIFTYRLHRYVNVLISVLIYHIKKNQKLTITEILYSLMESYDWYMEFIAKLDQKTLEECVDELISPEYLYI